MKNFRRFCLALVLMAAFALPAFADGGAPATDPGDVHTPGLADPGDIHTPGLADPGDIHTPGLADPGDVHTPGLTEDLAAILIWASF